MRAAVILLCAASCAKAKPPAPAIEASAAFVDVTVIGPGGREVPHQTVLVKGDQIVAVGAVDATPVAAGTKSIAGAGKWLAPGLIDMHVHFNDERDALLYVANGVTTVRNMWGGPPQLAWRKRSDWLAPTVYTTGPIVDGNPPTWPGSTVVETAEAGATEVAAEKQAGYDFVKMYSGLPLVAYDAIAAEAKKQGIRFVGHVPRAVPLLHALEAGQASIEHMTGYHDALDGGATVAQLVKATRDAGTANVPTLVVLNRFATLDHPEALMGRAENRYVSPAVVAGWKPSNDFRLAKADAAKFEQQRARYKRSTELVKALVDGGAIVLAGTDTSNPFVWAGFAMHEELALLVAAGLTPKQAFAAATEGPAKWLGAEGKIGAVAVGARADLMLLDADPLADITATTKRSGVMLRGTWYPQSELQTKLDALAKSFTEVRDRFAGMSPLETLPNATLVTFNTTFAGADAGTERIAISDGPNGRVIAAQFSGEPPQHVTSHYELDAKGAITAARIDADGAVVKIERAGDKLHVTGPNDAIDLPGDTLVDADILATILPFADRALRANGTLSVAGKLVHATPKLAVTDVTYAFKRKTDKVLELKITQRFPAEGTFEVDDHGILTSLSVKTPMGEFTAKRQP